MYPAPRVTRHLPTRPSQHSPGPLPPGARQEACRGGRSRSLVVLSRNSRCPLPEPGPREGLWRARRPVAQGRRSVGGEGPRRPPCAGSSLERGPHPLRPSPGAVPAQAPVSPPRLSPRGPLSLPLLARSGAAAPAAGWKLPPRLCLDAFLRITGAPEAPGWASRFSWRTPPGPGARQRCLSGKPQLAVRCCGLSTSAGLSASAGSRLVEEQGPWAWCFLPFF